MPSSKPSNPETPAPPLRRGWRRRAFRWGAALFAVPLVAILGLALIGAFGPVALPGPLVSWMEARVNARVLGAETRLVLNRVGLGFDRAANTFTLVLEDARLEGAAQLDLPQTAVTLSATAALQGRFEPGTLRVAQPSLRLTRALDGTLRVGLGAVPGGFVAPADLGAALRVLDRALAQAPLARLETVELSRLSLVIEDQRRGVSTQVNEGFATFENRADAGQSLRGVFELGARSGGLAFEVARDAQGAVTFWARADDLSSRDLAGLLAPDHALSALGTSLSGVIEGRLSAAGQVLALSADLDFGAGRLPMTTPLAYDRAEVNLAYDGTTGRIAIERLAFSSELTRFVSTGQAFLEVAAPGQGATRAVVQMGLTRLDIDPDGIQGIPMAFDEGLLEARVQLAPFSLEVAQAMLGRAGERLRARGQITLEDARLRGMVEVRSDQVTVPTLLAIWPRGLVPKTRRWAAENLLGGAVTNLAAVLRSRPGDARPEASATFEIANAKVRVLRFLPPAEQAFGAAVLHDNRLSLRVDRARVPSGYGGGVQLGGTLFTIPDIRVKPTLGEVDLALSGPIGDVLTLLDNPPFEVLKKAGRGPDLARGQVQVAGRIETPLVKDTPLSDISLDLRGSLRDVESDVLVPGRRLSAASLDLRLSDAEGVEISGAALLGEMPIRARWTQALVPKGAPPPPAYLSGQAEASAAALQSIGIDLSALGIRGETAVNFAAELAQGQPARLLLDSDLAGLSLSLPSIAWGKRATDTGALTLAVPIGPTDDGAGRVLDVSMSVSGMDLGGQIALRADGTLEEARLERLAIGTWLRDARATIRPQGGAASAMTLRAGALDLRRFAGASGGAGRGQLTTAITATVDRLTVANGIALTDVQARVDSAPGAGISGDVSGLLNGRAAVRAQLATGTDGPLVRVRAADAGRVLAAAGVFANGIGGAFDLRLQATTSPGTYAGQLDIQNLRVRNAPAMAALLSAISVVGLLEQLSGEGILFSTVDAQFALRPDRVDVARASASGPSMAITADGTYALGDKTLDLQGVVSPLYMVNGIFGALLGGRRNEGLVGVNYRLTGAAQAPRVQVNPLSVLTPGIFREIFRRPAPDISQ